MRVSDATTPGTLAAALAAALATAGGVMGGGGIGTTSVDICASWERIHTISAAMDAPSAVIRIGRQAVQVSGSAPPAPPETSAPTNDEKSMMVALRPRASILDQEDVMRRR